jgi:DNA-binding protein H-NS
LPTPQYKRLTLGPAALALIRHQSDDLAAHAVRFAMMFACRDECEVTPVVPLENPKATFYREQYPKAAELRIWSVMIIIWGRQRAISQLARSSIGQLSPAGSRGIGDATMKHPNFATMSIDELWSLRERTRAVLLTKLEAEKHDLERRSAQLNVRVQYKKKARPYPSVHPKYRNPARPSETWSGRGKPPLWVGAHLRLGKTVDDLLIARAH